MGNAEMCRSFANRLEQSFNNFFSSLKQINAAKRNQYIAMQEDERRRRKTSGSIFGTIFGGIVGAVFGGPAGAAVGATVGGGAGALLS